MVDTEAIDRAEAEIDLLINICHKQGLTYWEVLRIFLCRCQTLQMQADAEYWANLRDSPE